MKNISPLGALLALIIVGVTVELVEQENKTAAYGLVLLILLGMITFNAQAFTQQMTLLIALVNAKSGAIGGRSQGLKTAPK